ncbi:hypothetical protein [Variovorax guangxiensis]|uniref:hypothetical protein n=1 Tax=Variovorax guangxiensis TaxID=1775474 RepID=UPI0028674C76|nr:hypothetical protein [Variovorax guangxiensis]MDR6859814.1 hypothetical protein [Variovorax guangxiensis]
MSTDINRRGFLAALVAAGATLALPGSVAEATSNQVDRAFAILLLEPWIFAVINDSGTLVDPAVAQPRLRSDVFGIPVEQIESPERLIREVNHCDPLRSCFQAMAANELDDLQQGLKDKRSGRSRQEGRKLRRLVDALQDEFDGWRDWVVFEGKEGLPRFREIIEHWLMAPIDWDELEWFPRACGGQGAALNLFGQMEGFLRDEIGVTIVDQPGSSYFAAELHLPAIDANHSARRLGLPIRFRDDASDCLAVHQPSALS